MKSNPIEIPPRTIFICGNMGDPGAEKQFGLFAEQLDAGGHKYVNPLEIPLHNVMAGKIQSQIVSYMAMCDLVVTLNGWERSPNATNLVAIARIMKKEIIVADLFSRFEETQKLDKTDNLG